jgi:ketosteroid isomerase-like protein
MLFGLPTWPRESYAKLVAFARLGTPADDFEWRLAAGAVPSGTVLRGKEGLRAHFADKSTAHREASFSEAKIHRAGEKLFGTFRVTGIDAQGRSFDRYGIDLYELRDGKIALKDSYLKA